MDRFIIISRQADNSQVIGDVVRLQARHFGQPVFIDMCLIQWTVLRDQNPVAEDAFCALEKLAREGRWVSDADGVRSLLVQLPPLVVEHSASA